MQFKTSNCVAIGVPDMDEALTLYAEKLGFEITRQSKDWSELNTGALKLYLVRDNVREPCFDLAVDDVPAAEQFLAETGFIRVDLAPNEVFMRDPYGYLYCLSSTRISPS
jgi:catechol 2,3-dioxygenase-like lactoylglutathione lyase family enzyme